MQTFPIARQTRFRFFNVLASLNLIRSEKRVEENLKEEFLERTNLKARGSLIYTFNHLYRDSHPDINATINVTSIALFVKK